MKRLVLMAFMLGVALSFAGVVEPFKQFTQADYHDYVKPGLENDAYAKMITLSVKADTNVWLSNYVNNWYNVPDLHGDQYDMLGEKKYGYIFKSDLPDASIQNRTYADKIHWADGDTTVITYYDDANPDRKVSTTGYFLDHFDDAAEIYLVMTTLEQDGNETVDSFQYVQAMDPETTLVSRQHNLEDLADNVRVNYGVPVGREFVAVYDGLDSYPGKGGGAAGGPLPGLLFVGLLSTGTVFGASRMKKRS